MTTPRIEPDRIRISAYYDGDGRCTNLDVILNENHTLTEIEQVMVNIVKACKPSPLTSWTGNAALSTNGRV